MKLWTQGMDELQVQGHIKVATYGGWCPSKLLEQARSAELLVGYFREEDSSLVFASIAATWYPHVKVRIAFESHRKYCLTSTWAYLGSSNLGSTKEEVGIIVKESKVISELRTLHKQAWKQSIPYKGRGPLPKNPNKLLEAAL